MPGHRLLVINDIVFVSLKANSVDPDEMPCYVAFQLSLHCLSNYAGSKGFKELGYPVTGLIICNDDE